MAPALGAGLRPAPRPSAVCAPGRGAARPSLPPSAAPPALFAHFASCRARALWARPLVRSGAARPPAVRPLRPGPPRSLARPLCAAARLRGLSLAPAGSWVVLRSAAGSPFGVALAPLRAPQSPARGPAGPPRALRPSGFGGSPPRFARRRAGSRPGGPARPFGPLVGASGPPGLWLRARACAGLLAPLGPLPLSRRLPCQWILPCTPPPRRPRWGAPGSARLVGGWERSRRRPSALHASSRVGAGAQVNKGRLPRNFKLDKSERTCYYTGARLVSGPWAPAFEQSVTLGESVVRKGGAFFGPFSAHKREIFRRSLPGSGMPGSQHNQPGKIPV